jgi:hypothetical protein
VASSAKTPRRQDPTRLSRLISVSYKGAEKMKKYFYPSRNGMVCREIGTIDQ